MAAPWFDENVFGTWFGVIAGGGGGLLAGLVGAAAGVLAPRGKARGLVLGGMAALVALGLAFLALGLVALVGGQPYGIWYGPVLVGAIFTAVFAPLIPVARRAYTLAEERRLQAEALRRG
jgi:hypothetical protein